jgi:hypothetical protein
MSHKRIYIRVGGFVQVDNGFGYEKWLQGGAFLGALSREAKFQLDEIYEVFNSVRT